MHKGVPVAKYLGASVPANDRCFLFDLYPRTRIRYDVPRGSTRVRLLVFDVSGRRVRTLVDEIASPGQRHVWWDGRTDHGRPAASGIYFLRTKAGEYLDTMTLQLLR